MKNIIAAIDFSPVSKNAAEYACELSKSINASLTLLYIYHISPPINETPIIVSYEELQEQNEKLLQKEAIRLKEKTGVNVTCVVKIGLAVDEILEESKHTDLIIMGIKDTSKVSELLIGSTATSVMKKSQTPVLIIPDKCTFKKPETIAFTCDFKPDTNTKSINILKAFQKLFNAKITVVNVKPKKELLSTDQAIGGVILEGDLEGTEHVYYFHENESLIEGINEFIERYDCDIVATIPHHYNFIETLFHKSISKTIAFHAHLPILCIPDYKS